jgi:hypothetical protein
MARREFRLPIEQLFVVIKDPANFVLKLDFSKGFLVNASAFYPFADLVQRGFRAIDGGFDPF